MSIEDETAYRKAWEINVLRRINEASALEYLQPLSIVQNAFWVEETYIVKYETFHLHYFVYLDTRLGELLFNCITAAALIWGVASCILSML